MDNMAMLSSVGETWNKKHKKGKKGNEKGNEKGKGRVGTGAQVAESVRIRFAELLEKFRDSSEEECTLDNNLTNFERAAVHVLCKKLGLKSKSYGKGEQRCITVYKNKQFGAVEDQENLARDKDLVSFRFSKESKDVLQDLFSRYPPDDAEMAAKKVATSSGTADKRGEAGDKMFRRPVMSLSEIENKMESFASRIKKDPTLKQITEKRSKLPIASFKDVITSSIVSNQVVLICGETGCGKTTQVPQFLLDHAWSKGETCKIVCTQPRRISATSVADRIASERGEYIGDTVGYKIRMESKGGRQSSVVFCTNGVLLRVLVSKGGQRKTKKNSKKTSDEISDITHIIVDEIHERDRFSDFMLAIMRDILPSYPHLRLVLMSATIDAERFSTYFGGCPIIRVPGFTHPVKTFYLEDVLSMVMKSPENNQLSCTTPHEKMEVLTEEYRVPHEKMEDLTDEYRDPLDEEAMDLAMDLALSNDEFDPLLELLSSQGDKKMLNYQHSETGETPLMVFAQKGRITDICMLLSFDADVNLRSKAGKTALDCAQQGEAAEIIKKHIEKISSNTEEQSKAGNTSPDSAQQCEDAEIIEKQPEIKFSQSEEGQQKLIDQYMSNAEPEVIDCGLIEILLRRICSDSEEGAILIFYPGWADISRAKARLLDIPFFSDSSKFCIIPLHSMVPSADQKKVFNRPPKGCRKIILSTNIAETSVTIDDVVYVINTGRMKEKSYDPYNNVTTLHSSWVSKASAKQREGRAGRCQPGVCYHLYSELLAASLPDFQVPEIKRMPIEELCLQVKMLDPTCKIQDFLQKILDPPVLATIHNAITVLQDIGALSPEEELTELGEKFGSLAVHPLISRMLFVGILLNCLDVALTLASTSEYQDPFIQPMNPNDKKKADEAKMKFAPSYGGQGDQLAVLAAFEGWRKAKQRGEQNRFCSENFISSNTMRMIDGMRQQLAGELHRSGFIPKDSNSCSLNSSDPGIIHAVLLSGLYPLVGRVLLPSDRQKPVVETAGGQRVKLSPHSTNAKLPWKQSGPRPLIVYDEITRGDGGLFVKNSTRVGPLPLLLLAKEIVVAPGNDEGEDDDGDDDDDESEEDDFSDEEKKQPKKELKKEIMSSPDNTVRVVVDQWLPFESIALDVAQIYCLRERLSTAILFKITRPREDLPEKLGASVYAIACILSYDGMIKSLLPVTDIGQTDQGRQNELNSNNGRHHKSGNGSVSNYNYTPPHALATAHEHKAPVSRGKYSRRSRGWY